MLCKVGEDAAVVEHRLGETQVWLPFYSGHLWWQARSTLAAAEPTLLCTCSDGGGTQSLVPPGRPLVPLAKQEDRRTPACLTAVPWSFLNLTTSCTKGCRHFVCNVRLPQTIAHGRCTLPMALCGVAGVPCCCSPGELLGCARSSSVPRFPPRGARHPSPAGFLGTRMVY